MNSNSPFTGLSLIKDKQEPKANGKNVNEIQVYGIGEIICLPDICEIKIFVTSIKDDVATAKNSVIRRLDYIVQAAHNHRIKSSNMKVSKVLRRVKDQFKYSATISFISSDFNLLEELCNLLIEKLDSSVIIGEPHLRHSREHIERSRRSAADLALNNARAKGTDMARQFAMTLGVPLLIREDTAEEVAAPKRPEDAEEDRGLGDGTLSSWCGNPEAKSLSMRAKVFVSFELRKTSKH